MRPVAIMRKPTNHVTRAAAERLLGSTPKEGGWPEVPADLVEYLETIYPAKCKAPGEDPEEHMQYGGIVKLIGILRDQSNRQADFTDADLEEGLRE